MFGVSLTTWLLAAGLGQLALCLGSLWIPRVLGWRRELLAVSPLTRQVFWTYAGYIWGTNLAFALLSLLGPRLLIDGGTLARGVAGFIAVYWGARLVIQFACFDRARPPGRFFVVAELALVGLFVFFTAVYAWIALAPRP